MNIVVLKERMENEGRVAVTPWGCLEAKKYSIVWVEAGSGEQSGYSDDAYRASGARVLPISELIPLLSLPETVVLKVKQPILADRVWLLHAKNCTVFAYFHSTGEDKRDTIDTLLKKKITAISYENIQADDGTHPLLIPMSEIAGRRAVEIGVELSLLAKGKFGLSIKPPTFPQMLILGGGTVGRAALEEGLKHRFARIVVFEKDPSRALFLEEQFKNETQVIVYSLADSVYDLAKKWELGNNVDIVVGAAAVLGAHSPRTVTLTEVESMRKGSVIVDVSIDQGGCVERPTGCGTGIFEHNGVTFCCIPNLPGSVPKESAPALSNAILPYLLSVLSIGLADALKTDSGFRAGLLTHDGKVMDKKAASYWDEDYTDPRRIF
ncbi:MAG: hypothetical protein HYT94_01680 [Parcubacteria group bacterium]|nr:hypothetical protein [Parcubacteria group bacterium]